MDQSTCRIPSDLVPTLLSALDESDEIILLLNRDLEIICSNQTALKFFEKTDLAGENLKALLLNLNHESLSHHLDKNLVYRSIFQYSPPFPGLSLLSQEKRYLASQLIPIKGDKDDLILFLARDITLYVEVIDALELSQRTDKITGLLNLHTFLEEMEKHLQSNPRYAGVIVIDLYNFSYINDFYGLAVGDTLLKEFGLRLKKAFEGSVILGRTYADEFTLFIPTLNHRTDLLQYLDYLELIFGMPFVVSEESINLTYNFGVSLYPVDGMSANQLYQKAHFSCLSAKRLGPNQGLFHNPTLESYLKEQIGAEKIIIQALELGWFTFYLQPYFNSQDLSLAGAESLVRIVKPDGEVIPPLQFISQLERSIHLERFEKFAFTKIKELINTLNLPLGLNLYPSTFYNQSFWRHYENELSGLTSPIILEITERATLEDPEKASEIIRWLKSFPQVKIALDDFGTGYSNLSYLRNLPIDLIKIDLSFIRVLKKSDPRSLKIVEAIIDLAHGIEAKALAEGVESKEQAEILTILGCDYLQGYYFDKPLPLLEFKQKYLLDQR